MIAVLRRLLGSLFLLLCATARAAPAEPVLAFAYPPPYTMALTAARAVMPLPVTLAAGKDPRALCVEKIGVQFKGRLDASFSAPFGVERSLGMTTQEGPVVAITVDSVAALAPGNYELRLRVADCVAGKSGKTLETHVVTLVRPGITLEQTGKLVIDRWLPHPWANTTGHANPSYLRLRPQDPTMSLDPTGLQVEPSIFSLANGGANVGSWTIMPPRKAPAGAAFDIALRPTGFPIGLATGQLHVRGADLAAALPIEVSVHTRLLPRWIIFAVVLGVAAGLLLRVHLQHKVDLAQARQPALEKLHRYREELDRIPDTAFQAKVKPLLDHLLQAIEADDPQAVTEAAAAAQNGANAAREQLNIDLKAASEAIDRFRNTFDVRSPLPSALRAACSEAVAQADACARLLQPPNPAAAQAGLAGHERHLVEHMAALLATLGNALERVLTPLGALAPFLADAARARLAEKIKVPEATLQAIDTPHDLASAGGMLAAVARLMRELRALLDWSAQVLETDGPALDELIKTRARGTALEAERVALVQQWRAMAASLRAQAQLEDCLAPPAWGDAAAALLAAGRTLLGRLATSRTDLAGDEGIRFRQAIDEGAWHRALTALKPANPVMHGTAQTAAAQLPPEPAPALAGIVYGRYLSRPPGIDALSPLTIAQAAHRNRRQLAISQASMSVIVALLLAWASFAFYENSFSGTWAELLGLFFFGFSADLSADKLASTVDIKLPK